MIWHRTKVCDILDDGLSWTSKYIPNKLSEVKVRKDTLIYVGAFCEFLLSQVQGLQHIALRVQHCWSLSILPQLSQTKVKTLSCGDTIIIAVIKSNSIKMLHTRVKDSGSVQWWLLR